MPDEQPIRNLYQDVLNCWNRRDATAFAALFLEDGQSIGFDGSRHVDRPSTAVTLGEIFARHQTPSYIGIVRDIRWLSPDIAVLSAVAGLVPAGKSDINPAVNSVQSLVAKKVTDGWQIALFHNTPAAYHGRPELCEQLTEELRQALRARTA